MSKRPRLSGSGEPGQPGGEPVLTATSDPHAVTINLDVSSPAAATLPGEGAWGTSDPVLELADVSKVYPGSPPVRALNGVSVSVAAGELVAVAGPSGPGKSTLLHLIGTLDRATSGVVRVTGLEVARMRDRELSAPLGLLEELNEQGTTIIVITHDHAVAARLRRRIEVLDGHIISDIIGHHGHNGGMTDRYYTASTTFLQALAEAGARCIFANFGSDHTGIIEAMAQARSQGQAGQLPRLIVCPHETAALSAAHAYAMRRGQPQAATVQVDADTQNLGGAVNNAMRGRVPVLIFADSAPATQEGKLPGGRNEFIHWIQDVRNQRGLLRNYVKFDNELRSGRNVKQIVHQALQIARSELAGLVYLTAHCHDLP
jgi:hypothetical protein